ncbi:hypothetical protein JVU11DRAFT_3030 [Chiua virens]|nr:hypothetical protein JVU11DRAFT_3030 [Chiua virens]
MNLLNFLFNTELPATGWQFIAAAIVQDVPAFTLTPRFIISMREMYTHNVQARHGDGIDTGFGLSTMSGGGGAAGGPMVFAAGVQSEVGDIVEVEAA